MDESQCSAYPFESALHNEGIAVGRDDISGVLRVFDPHRPRVEYHERFRVQGGDVHVVGVLVVHLRHCICQIDYIGSG